MSTGYALAYRWDHALGTRGEVAKAGFNSLLDREEGEPFAPLGQSPRPRLGRGLHTTSSRTAAGRRSGSTTFPGRSRRRAAPASRTTFVVGDVTKLSDAALGTFDFFLDVGCFRGLGADERRAEASGGDRPRPAGRHAPAPRVPAHGDAPHPGRRRQDGDRGRFAGWELLSVEPADTAGMRATEEDRAAVVPPPQERADASAHSTLEGDAGGNVALDSGLSSRVGKVGTRLGGAGGETGHSTLA